MKRLKVHFYLKGDKEKNGVSPIYGKIHVGTSSATFSTGKTINPDRWKKTKGLKSATKLANEASVKNYLHELSRQINDEYLQLIRSSKGDNLTASQLKDVFWDKKVEKKEITIMEIINLHNSSFKLSVQKSDRAQGSLEKYIRMGNTIQQYLQEELGVRDIAFSKIDSTFVYDFDEFLRFKKRHKTIIGLSHNTTVKYIKNIKVIFNYAVRKGKIKTNPFSCYDETLKEVKTVFLTQDEIERIENKQFSTQRLDLVRDLFIFTCFTSYAPVDVFNLKKSNIQLDKSQIWAKTSRQKTKVESNVPLLDPVVRIIDKYKDDPRCANDDRLFPKISNAKMNEYLKEIADLCGITKRLTWYVGRHTFGTTVTLGNGVKIEHVSKMMGHKKISQTQHYAKVLDENVGSEMFALNRIYK